jgi:hypothetical protein
MYSERIRLADQALAAKQRRRAEAADLRFPGERALLQGTGRRLPQFGLCGG